MLDFGGKIILVTGATQGIGRGIADGFAQAGGEVHITGTRASRTDYADLPPELVYHRADLSTPAGRQALREEVGDVDVLVNNVGLSRADEYEIDGFRKTVEVNLVGMMEMCLLYRDCLAARSGPIVNIGSVASHLALKETPGYTASKAGVLGLTRALADKWAPLGVRVNMIAPGFIHTQATAKMRVNPAHEKRLIAAVPMRRWGVPSEISGAALFLASPLATYVTGVSLAVDGGLMVR